MQFSETERAAKVGHAVLRTMQSHLGHLALDAGATGGVPIFDRLGTRLYDVPFVRKTDGGRSGFALVSVSRDRPPVLQISPSGPSFVEQILGVLFRRRSTVAAEAKVIRIVYWSATSFYAELAIRESRRIVHIPTAVSVGPEWFDKNISNSKMATQGKDRTEESFKPHWDALEPVNSILTQFYLIANAGPVRYSQVCERPAQVAGVLRSFNSAVGVISRAIGAHPNQCSPYKIMGCTPVAWATLFSSWKNIGFRDTDKIWAGSPCWKSDWPLGGPSLCADVERTMWALNSAMGTSVDGETSGNSTIRGGDVLQSFGIAWVPSPLGPNFDAAARLIDAGQPLLWTATGNWTAIPPEAGEQHIPKGTDIDGHSLVAFGYMSSLRMLYVCLGWGDIFPDRWLYYDDFTQHEFFYIG